MSKKRIKLPRDRELKQKLMAEFHVSYPTMLRYLAFGKKGDYTAEHLRQRAIELGGQVVVVHEELVEVE